MQCWDFWFHILLSHQWVVIICWWSVGVGIRWWSLGVGGGGNSMERKLGQRVSLPNLWWTAEVQNHSKYHRPWSTAYRYSWNDAGMKNYAADRARVVAWDPDRSKHSKSEHQKVMWLQLIAGHRYNKPFLVELWMSSHVLGKRQKTLLKILLLM